jgi:hypothetical protein
MADMGPIATVGLAMLAGSLRVSTPFLFVSLGECLTEKAGRINLGNEGVLVLGAMVGYAVSYETDNCWAGLLAAMMAGIILGGIHGAICNLPRVNDVAMGIAIMLAGTGLAFFFGKPYIQPSAPRLPSIPFGFWSDSQQVRSALDICPLFFIGIAAAFVMHWVFRTTRIGLRIRIVGDSNDAARALGLPIGRTRLLGYCRRQRPRWDWRRVPVAELPRQLERGPVLGAGADGGGAGGVLPLEPDRLRRGVPAVRCRRRARAFVADGRGHLGLLSVLRRTLHRHLDYSGGDRRTRPGTARHSRRTHPWPLRGA